MRLGYRKILGSFFLKKMSLFNFIFYLGFQNERLRSWHLPFSIFRVRVLEISMVGKKIMNKMKVVLITRCLQMAESRRESEKDREEKWSQRGFKPLLLGVL